MVAVFRDVDEQLFLTIIPLIAKKMPADNKAASH
jgi:hypothetical protein